MLIIFKIFVLYFFLWRNSDNFLRCSLFFPQRKVRLRYKLTLMHGDQHLSETGEIDNFPDWMSLTGN